VRESTVSVAPAFGELEQHRAELTAYCYRMLGSPFDAEDAVQDAFVRAWRSRDRFEGRAAMRSWLYRIATNVCLDALKAKRRTTPMDLGPAREPVEANLNVPTEITWLEPIPLHLVATEPDPAEVAVANESIRLAFIAALQRLPARQRAVLILREVLDWQASEVAELLDTSVASVNSALQRARATLARTDAGEPSNDARALSDADRALLERYIGAFERYDLKELTALIQEDARQSMPPFDLWLSGRDDMMRWWFGPGILCKGSRVVRAPSANGMPTFGQYKPSPTGGYDPWALQVLEVSGGKIAEITFFLDTAHLFPLFGLPLHLDA